MDNEEDCKRWLDTASYTELLTLWRHGDLKSPIFQGSIGLYFREIMRTKSKELSEDQLLAASESVGWANLSSN